MQARKILFDHLVRERKAPCFEIMSSQLQIITDPTDYYLALHKLANQAEHRISMTALYLGTGKLEKYLVEKLQSKMQSNDRLKLTILMDYMRGTRIGRDGSSSLDLIKQLRLKNFNRQVRLGFYHNPDTGMLKGKFSSSPLREIFGVHHMKAHVFDNNVMITGANLSEDYFTDRQDRCIVIQDCEPLADWFHELIQILSDCSYQVNDLGDLAMLPIYPEPWKQPQKFKEQLSHHLKYFRYSHKTNISTQSDLSIESFFENKPLQVNDDHHFLRLGTQRPFKQQTLTVSEPLQLDQLRAETQFLSEAGVNYKKTCYTKPEKAGRVFLFPTLQMNVINYREDEELFLKLLNELEGNLKIATGYLNLTKEYLKALGGRKQQTQILTSSPRANGFYKAGRVKKYIPGIYRVNEINTLQKYPNLDLYEWEAFGWTYHAKGAWFYNEKQQVDLSVIGSSNYSHRSNRRDTECQLYILAECEDLQNRLHLEAQNLFDNSKQVTLQSLKQDSDKVSWREKLLNKMVKKLI